ncbi:MAG TPA: amidohydrolase family protein [Bryobacteraceae bacterium]|nr:amidohydrolase family protein [Bryobacteraceae bacterium]
MLRRHFLRMAPLGAAAATCWPQGREFRKNPPIAAPASRRIIDMHVHTFFQENAPQQAEFTPRLNNSRPDGVYQMNAGWDQFRYDMDPVYRAVILHVAFNDVGRQGNNANAAIAKRWPEKLIPFGSINPNFPDALDEFKRGVKELGLKGFKMSPIYQKFDPMAPGALRIYSQAQEWGIPLIFHTATAQAAEVPLKWANPVLFDEVAYSFPRLRIVMAHLGHPWQRECIVMMRKHPNVYAELSGNFYRPWDLYQALLTAMDWGQTHKILFGTDWPITTARESLEGLRALNQFARAGLPRIPDEIIDGILYRDSLSLLGIT